MLTSHFFRMNYTSNTLGLAFIFFLTFIYLKWRHKKEKLQLFYHPQSGIFKKVVEKTKLRNMVIETHDKLFYRNSPHLWFCSMGIFNVS